MSSAFMKRQQEIWNLLSMYHQALAWEDAEKARLARDRAEAQAAQQLQAMLEANPSGQLGTSCFNDAAALTKAGLL